MTLLICLGVVIKKGWLKTFLPLILLTLHLVIPSLLEDWPPYALLLKILCSPYGFLQNTRVIVLYIVIIERG